MNKKIAILTSGGDSPGMNNAIRGIVKTANLHQIKTYLVYEGFKGLTENKIKLSSEIDVDSYLAKGGTFIGSSRYLEFKNPDVRKKAAQNLKDQEIDSLIVIGGNGSYAGAQLLHDLGLKVIAIPGTIDNDISSSDYTIGFNTALKTIIDSVDQIRDTMDSMRMVALIEVMGHGAGDLALYSGLATGAEIIVTNSHRKSVREIIAIVKDQIENKSKKSVLGIVSEFIYDDIKLVAKEIQKELGINSRGIVVGYAQRGGVPTALERINSTLFGISAVENLIEGKSGIALGFKNGEIISIPIQKALEEKAFAKEEENKIVAKYNKLNQS